jgi:hypothetical protein
VGSKVGFSKGKAIVLAVKIAVKMLNVGVPELKETEIVDDNGCIVEQ